MTHKLPVQHDRQTIIKVCTSLLDTYMKEDCRVLAAPVGIQMMNVTVTQKYWSLTSEKQQTHITFTSSLAI